MAAVERTISHAEIWARLQHGPPLTLVEALGPSFHEAVHLPGAVNVTTRTSDAAVARLLPDRAVTVVVYCSAGAPLARRVARRLEDLGYADVLVYLAGKEGWAEAGLPLDRSGDA